MTPSIDTPGAEPADFAEGGRRRHTAFPVDAPRRSPPRAAAAPTASGPAPANAVSRSSRRWPACCEQPGADRVTTAALAAKLEVSEAALYRHFASKAQMFEGLIEFIEQSVFTLVNQIVERENRPAAQAQGVLAVLLQFGEKNPGMTRVMVGDALVFENDRLTARMNQFFERIESQLRQSLRQPPRARARRRRRSTRSAQASVLTAFAIGRLQRFARSGFRKSPTEHLDVALRLFAA